MSRASICASVTSAPCGADKKGKLGYLEFHGARRALSSSTLRRSIRGEIALEAVERRIGEATSVQACWEAVRDASRQLGFSQIEARLEGLDFLDSATAHPQHTCWQHRVPLGERFDKLPF